jgi:two-component system nitrogen regulation sensor histidine kinase NtrY
MTTREGGTGLGLAIVAKIFEEHGGGIELADNPNGRGGRVRMWFPTTAGAEQAGTEDSTTVHEPRRARA